MRKLYWYFTGYVRKHGWVFLLSLATAIAVFSFLVPVMVDNITFKPREFVGVIGGYSLTSLPPEIKNQLSVGLTKITDNKEVVPLLAERWVVEDEGKRYRFVLKEGVVWQDGQEITPEDINYQFVDVETIATPNDVIFKLPDAFAPFPSVVSEPIFRQGSEKYLVFFERPTLIGIGANRVIDYKKKGSILKELVVETTDKRIIYRFYLTEDDMLNAFKRGEIDIIPDLSSPRDLIDWPNVSIEPKLQTNRYLAVFFNNADPVLTKNVRQALAYAVANPGDETQALGPIDPDSWAYLEGGKAYDKDLARASERLLDELPHEPLKLTLTTTSLFTAEAEEIKQEWETLGDRAESECNNSKDVKDKELCVFLKIEVDLKITNFPDTNDFQLLLMGQESQIDPDQYFLWHSEQPTNFTRYKNTRIDSLLEKGRKTLEQQERTAIYQEFQQFLLEDPPAIFLKHLWSYEVRR